MEGIRTGISRCNRINVPDDANSIAIPSDVSWAVFRNAGNVPVRFNFNTDGASDYFTLGVGVTSPIISVVGGKTFNTDGVGGSTVLEVISWG
jgi:hypothetical protein